MAHTLEDLIEERNRNVETLQASLAEVEGLYLDARRTVNETAEELFKVEGQLKAELEVRKAFINTNYLLEEQLREAVKLLTGLEWSTYSAYSRGECPICTMSATAGHKGSCKLGTFLKPQQPQEDSHG